MQDKVRTILSTIWYEINITIIHCRFSSIFPSDRELRNMVKLAPMSRGGALDKALTMAKDHFKKEARPNAHKIMVVIMDKKVKAFYLGYLW